MKLRVQHDQDFGVEVLDGDKVVAKVGADFLYDNGLFEDDTTNTYERGTDVVTATLGALLGDRYLVSDRDLRRVVRRLVEPGGYFDESQLVFEATEAVEA